MAGRGEFLPERFRISEFGIGHGPRLVFEASDVGIDSEIRGVVSGGRKGRGTIRSIADGIRFQKPRQIAGESDFSKSDAVGICANGYRFFHFSRNESSSGTGTFRDDGESSGEDKGNLFIISFSESGMGSEVSPNRDVGEVSEVFFVTEIERVLRGGEGMLGGVVDERKLDIVPGSVRKRVPGF